MYKVHCLNKISPIGTNLLTEQYEQTPELKDAEAVLVRSAAMHDMEVPQQLAAIARAGAGAAATVVMMLVPIMVFVFNQSKIVETMGASGMKD